jgi:hypothetical protein
MEQTMQQIREMISVAEVLIRPSPKEAPAHYAKMEPSWTRLQAEREEDIKAKEEKSRAIWAKIDADREKRKADMKAFNEMLEGREAERKANEERRMVERKAEQERKEAERKSYEKRMAERKADQEKWETKRKVDREVATRLEAIHDKTDANQMRVEPETEHQKKMAAWIADTKNDRRETTAFQEAMEASLEKMEPNPGEKEVAVGRQEIPNEEVAVHSLNACRNERTACQKATKANPEKMQPIDHTTATLEQMIAMTKTKQENVEATDLEGNSEEMECESEHREVPKEEAAVMPVGGLRKRRRDQNLTTVRRRKPEGKILANCESRNRLTVAGRRMTRCA